MFAQFGHELFVLDHRRFKRFCSMAEGAVRVKGGVRSSTYRSLSPKRRRPAPTRMQVNVHAVRKPWSVSIPHLAEYVDSMTCHQLQISAPCFDLSPLSSLLCPASRAKHPVCPIVQSPRPWVKRGDAKARPTDLELPHSEVRLGSQTPQQSPFELEVSPSDALSRF